MDHQQHMLESKHDVIQRISTRHSQTPDWSTYRSHEDLLNPNMREITHSSSVAPMRYPRIAPKIHAISARRHPQWATCKLRAVPTWIGADRKPLRRHRRPKSGNRGCSARNHTMADTMDTLPTSRARRLAVQRPRWHSVLGKPVKASNRPTSKK